MSRQRDRRRQRRRARAGAEQHDIKSRHAGITKYGVQSHWVVVDAMRALMERSPAAARLCVALGGVGLVLAILWLVWLVVGLLGA